MDCPSIQVEEAVQTPALALFDIYQDDEALQLEATKNMLLTKKLLERITRTEKEIENSVKKASK